MFLLCKTDVAPVSMQGCRGYQRASDALSDLAEDAGPRTATCKDGYSWIRAEGISGPPRYGFHGIWVASPGVARYVDISFIH